MSFEYWLIFLHLLLFFLLNFINIDFPSLVFVLRGQFESKYIIFHSLYANTIFLDATSQILLNYGSLIQQLINLTAGYAYFWSTWQLYPHS